MCGRYTLTLDPGKVDTLHLESLPVEFGPRYNIAPTQPVAVVPNTGENKLDFFVWGLIPSWAKDPAIGSRMINARAETVAEKPSFRGPFRRKRCLILADGFFEWQKLPNSKTKQPMYIYLKDHSLFAFAGLWDTWFSPDGSEVRSCTIITTEPNELVKPIHNRMPVILPIEAYPSWLNAEETPADKLTPLLKPYAASEMSFHPVSRFVNRPANDTLECIQPIQ
jgi:putative SOS response-associated peptidase YedK